MAKDLLKGRNDRLEIHVLRQEAQADEVVAQLSEIAVHQVDHRLDQAGAALTADLAHHSEVEIGQATIGQGQQVPGMGIGVEEAVLQQLLQGAVHPHGDHVVGVDPEFANGFEVGEFDPVDPLHRQHAPGRGITEDPGHSDAGVVGVELCERFGVGRLVAVVHFLEHPLTQLVDQGHEVRADQADVGVQPGRDVPDDVEVQGDLFPQSWALNLDGNLLAAEQNTSVDLAEGGR